MGTTIMEVRFPGIPPIQCLSTTTGVLQSNRLPHFAIAWVKLNTSALEVELAEATRNAEISIGE